MARRLATVNMKQTWFGHTETWPVIGCIAVALSWTTYMSTNYLTRSPDVQWRKDIRGVPVRDNHTEGERWTAHKRGLIDANIEEIAVTRGFKPKYDK